MSIVFFVVVQSEGWNRLTSERVVEENYAFIRFKEDLEAASPEGRKLTKCEVRASGTALMTVVGVLKGQSCRS